MESIKLGFIGGGNIVQAFINGLHRSNQLKLTNTMISCPNANEKPIFKQYSEYIQTTTSNIDLCRFADIVLFAVKSKFIKSICNELNEHLNHDDKKRILFVSVIPGLKILTIEKWLMIKNENIVRIMYNVAVATENGCFCFAMSKLNESMKQSYENLKFLFNAVGQYAGNVTEDQLDVVTALMGSGPAFFCLVCEAMADGAVKMGLPRDLALAMTKQTMVGCANLLLSSKDKHPAQLRDEIATPGGTTIYGLHALETKAVRGAFIDAISVAAQRAQNMSKELETFENDNS
ncbi:unnamed protein product [Didymodactylos carnosus]|uniref:Pyrroline-5-carboxylate reductase n=1 Tax=Didymodactylos carnosus TaxID=1234261 RepID=A0A814HVN9_9BILA|nr:unnamed protein product [Didymodactylos carnosus]CAF1014745.1 unnamed protein product [Didymodactylos carnosus]CAF3539255.1 unnamed protein product [Didymodactylos carnosus]CAF3786251.1 unnamed protein product [Didymodactylos carnosus]